MKNFKYWYDNILKKDLIYKTNVSNSYDIPKIDNITISSNLASAIENPKTIVYAATILKLVTNQKSIVFKAKQSLAGFKIRKGMALGCKVRMRRRFAFEFLYVFIFLSLAKIKSLKPCKVNDKGNISIGLNDFFVFPQLINDYDKFPKKITSIINIKLSKSNPTLSSLIFTGLQIPINVNNLKNIPKT